MENFNTIEFVGPSGYSYTIREENGADEEIISNQATARDLMNITNFISAIVVNTDATPTGKLTPKQALELPLRDRYAILIKSRILSLGNLVPFSYLWPGDKVPVYYEQDLNELVFDDYNNITEADLVHKPDAIPVYEDQDLLKEIGFKGYWVTLTSGKRIQFDLATGETERYAITLPEEKNTRNAELLARNLRLEVNGKWETVEQFSTFTVREMAEIRSIISKVDRLYSGLVEIEHPRTGEKAQYPIFSAPRFFFLTEA